MLICPVTTGEHEPIGLGGGLTVRELADETGFDVSHVPSHAFGALNCWLLEPPGHVVELADSCSGKRQSAAEGEHLHAGQLTVGGLSAKPGSVPGSTLGHGGGVSLSLPIHRRLVAIHPAGAWGKHTPVQLPGPSGPSVPASWQCVGSSAHGSGLLQVAHTRTRSGKRYRIGLVFTLGNRR